MTKLFATSLAVLTLLAGSVGATQAASIKNQVPTTTLQKYCATAGVGSETQAELTRDDGTKVRGSIHCEASDVSGSGATTAILSGTSTSLGSNDHDAGHSDQNESAEGKNDSHDSQSSQSSNDHGSSDSKDGNGQDD